MNKTPFKLQAKKAYERGRFKAAAKFLLFIVPLVCLSILTCGSAGLPLALACALGLTVVALKWRGEEYGYSVAPGLIAGTIAFSIPVLMHVLEICCRNNLEIILCAASGVLGGLIPGRIIARTKRRHKYKSLFFALVVAGLTAALGCASLEFGAVLGLFLALVITTVSSFSLTRLA